MSQHHAPEQPTTPTPGGPFIAEHIMAEHHRTSGNCLSPPFFVITQFVAVSDLSETANLVVSEKMAS